MPHKDPVQRKLYAADWAAGNRGSVLGSHKTYNDRRRGVPGSPERAQYNAAQAERARQAKARKAKAANAAANLVAKATELAREALAKRARGYSGEINPGRI